MGTLIIDVKASRRSFIIVIRGLELQLTLNSVGLRGTDPRTVENPHRRNF